MRLQLRDAGARVASRLNNSRPAWALSALIVLSFLLGGGSRADIQSLMILRPIAILLMGYGLMGLKWQQIRANAFLFAMAAAIIGLTLLQLIPLPPALWSTLPGRGLVVEIDQAAQLGAVWRPISLVPTGTWNAFFSLMVPLSALVLGARLNRDERWQLLPLIMGIGLVSGVLGVLQLGSGADSPLYFYQVTNNGSAVGLFANRNHQAVFLSALIPMLAVYASGRLQSTRDAKVKAFVAIAFGCFLVPLILVTGSRAGLIAAFIGLVSAPMLYQPRQGPRTGKDKGTAAMRRWRVWLAVLAATVVSLVLLTIFLGRGEAFDRMIGQVAGGEFRYKAWGPVLAMAWHYFPVGSGFGSFVEVYQLSEPRELLGTFYFNHAHNDWLELALTGGLPGLALLGASGIAFGVKVARLLAARSQRGRDYALAWMGALVIALFAIASGGDYPLRVPSLACLFVVAAVWLNAPEAISSQRETH